MGKGMGFKKPIPAAVVKKVPDPWSGSGNTDLTFRSDYPDLYKLFW